MDRQVQWFKSMTTYARVQATTLKKLCTDYKSLRGDDIDITTVRTMRTLRFLLAKSYFATAIILNAWRQERATKRMGRTAATMRDFEGPLARYFDGDCRHYRRILRQLRHAFLSNKSIFSKISNELYNVCYRYKQRTIRYRDTFLYNFCFRTLTALYFQIQHHGTLLATEGSLIRTIAANHAVDDQLVISQHAAEVRGHSIEFAKLRQSMRNKIGIIRVQSSCTDRIIGGNKHTCQIM